MISVSYLKSKYSKEETIKKIDESIADHIHVDLMDGQYVSTCNFAIEEVLKDLNGTKKTLDIHLMVQNPLQYIKLLATLNVWMISIHLDILDNPREVLEFIKSSGIKAGIVINPSEAITLVDDYLDLIDYVLIMSVIPGKGAQEFMESILPKVAYLQNKDILIGIDGGINNQTISYLDKYRVDNIISGSYICLSDDYDEAINTLKRKKC